MGRGWRLRRKEGEGGRQQPLGHARPGRVRALARTSGFRPADLRLIQKAFSRATLAVRLRILWDVQEKKREMPSPSTQSAFLACRSWGGDTPLDTPVGDDGQKKRRWDAGGETPSGGFGETPTPGQCALRCAGSVCTELCSNGSVPEWKSRLAWGGITVNSERTFTLHSVCKSSRQLLLFRSLSRLCEPFFSLPTVPGGRRPPGGARRRRRA